MLLRLFKGNSPGIMFLIAVIFIAVWITAFLYPSSVSELQYDYKPMPLYGLLIGLVGKNQIVGTAISAAIAGFMAFLLVNFNTTSFFINERTYLPALLYTLAGGFFPEYQCLNPVLPASLFLMIAIIRIIDGYRKPGVANNFFDAGILISTGSLFYSGLIWFGILVIIGIVLIRSVSLTEITISMLGLITPYLITFGIYYVMGYDLKGLISLLGENILLRTEPYFFSRLTIVAMIFGSIIVMVSLVYLITHLNSKKIKSRKTFALFIWTFLISIAVYIFLPSVSVEIIWITAIPVSYFLTHYFVFIKKKLVPEIFMAALFLLTIIIQAGYYR